MLAFGQGVLGQPLDGVYRVLHAETVHRDPLGRRRELGGIPPVEILSKVEAEFLARHDEQREVIEVAGGIALVLRAANVDDQAAVVLEDAVKLGGKELKPIDIPVGINVAVVLLADQPEGRSVSAAQTARSGGVMMSAPSYAGGGQGR